jgi:type VI secretion system secreted protein Hcp
MAIDYFLRLDNIPGESTDPTYKAQIQVLSFSFGVGNPVQQGTGTQGKPSFSDFNIMKTADKASPRLLSACALGTQIKSATFSAKRTSTSASPVPPVQIQFTNLNVTSVQESGSSELPAESVSFSYETIQYTDTPGTASAKPGTPVVFSYDLSAQPGTG